MQVYLAVCLIGYKMGVRVYATLIVNLNKVAKKFFSKKFDFSERLTYTSYRNASMLIMITSISPIHGVLSG